MPNALMPCSTGKTALRPKATNIPARKGRYKGVLNLSITDTAVHSAPSDVICTQVSAVLSGHQVSHHCPVDFLQSRIAPKPEVNARDEGTRDEHHNTDIVKLIADLIDPRTMVRDSVVSGGCQYLLQYAET